MLHITIVARKVDGNVFPIRAKHILDGTNNQVECLAALEATILGSKIGVKKIHLEGDS